VLAILAIGVLLGTVAVRDRFGSKIDRHRAEAIVKREGAGTWKNVTCRPWHGAGRYWDYSCRVESTRTKPFSFEVRFSGTGITDQSGP
jgi:hypothetical protein